jgi:hypothetical protein
MNQTFFAPKAALLVVLLCLSSIVYAQRPVTSATTTTQPATPESYTEGGQLYQWGQGNDIILESVVYEGETYFVNDLFTQISYNLVRVSGNGGVTFDRFGIFVEENSGNFNYAASLPGGVGNYSMETLLDEPIINRGANDVFKNATSTAQNIERVDVLYTPFTIPNLPTLDKVGFLAIEKDGNSTFKAAVVTSVDGSGNPLTWGPVVTVTASDYGIVTADFEFSFLVNNTFNGNPTRTGGNTEAVGISMITLSDLGVGTGDTVYGISFFDSNVADDADLSDVTNPSVFPNANGGGADIYGGLGAISTAISTIRGTIYLDINGNGTRESNEPGIPNISVQVLASDGGFQTVVTDSNGNYSAFLPEGITRVTVNESDPDLPPNFTRTQGTNPTTITTVKGQNTNLVNIGYTSDVDGDGVIDLDDVDDDNDGILDTDELTSGGTTYDPLGDEDGDTIVNYLDNTDNGTGDGSNTDYTDSNADGVPDVFDFDNDGIPNHLDLDADNDGIPDNIEAQTTAGYIAPSGAVGSGFTDADGDGLDDNYDPVVSGGTPGTAITPVNSDSAFVTDNPDYLDLDADEDTVNDNIEANLTLSGTVGSNGLDNFIDNGDDYTDVNGSFDDTQTDNFPDDGNNANLGLPNDVDWRDNAVLGEIDTDNDGIPDATDIDDDNDGILDSEEDANTDADNNPATDPTDTDGDGIPNYLDLDSDNDGIPDNIEGQATAGYIAPTGGVGNNGLLDVYENNDTAGATSFTPENTDGTGDPDYLDTDSDDDGTSDRVEANLSLSTVVGANGLDSNYESADNYTDVNGTFDDTPFNDFPDNPSGGEIDWRDDTSVFSDNDNDGVIDSVDLDDDNDGILDTDEGIASGPCPVEYNGVVESSTSVDGIANVTGAPDGLFGEIYTNGDVFDFDFGQEYPAGTQYEITWRRRNNVSSGTAVMILSESADDVSYTTRSVLPENTNNISFQTITITADIPFRYIRITKTDPPSPVDFEIDAIGLIPGTGCILDTDADGIPNYLDLDSDNDGIPDNIEAQTTQGYSPPDGVYDADGVDTAYTGGLTAVDTDSDGTPDYIDTDSDNDSFSDTLEAALTLSGSVGVNGLDNNLDNGDNYLDVNGSFDTSQFDNFPDQDFDALLAGDVDYRDATFSVDIDRDGIEDDEDLDDDNDGILDTAEGLSSLISEAGFDTLTTSSFGDNTGATITPWVLESGSGTNVIQVDGADGSNYGTGGPEFDAEGGAGNYFTVNGSAGVIYQTFTLTETQVIDYGGFISSRNSSSGEAKINIHSGTGSGGTILSSTGTRVTDNSSNWRRISNSVTLPAGTYSFVVELDESINFDEAFAFGGVDDDSDGIPNYIDLDADNDGIPDNIEAQSTAGYIAPTGSYSLSGIDLAYGTGLTPVNTDGDADPDYLDLDSDGDGTNDILESGLSTLPNDGSRVTGEVGNNGLLDTLDDDGVGDTDGDGLGATPSDGYSDVNGTFDSTQTNNFTDGDSDAAIGGDLDYRDTIVGVDTDGDGIANDSDVDDDNDGIPDTVESDGNDPDGDEDNDGTLNYLDTSDDGDGGSGGTTNYTDADGNGIPDVYDFDGDGVPNHLDIDADNDGIPDNVEAQTTTGYVAPADNDTDNDGLDDAYDPDCTPCGAVTGTDLSTPNNHDGTNNPDYIDTDSDNDGTFDISENNVSNGTDAVLDANTGASSDGTPDGIVDPSSFVDTDGDGLADVFEGADANDGYDVNDEINNPSTNLPDEDNDVNTTGDVDYRDDTTGVVTPAPVGYVLWLRADIDVTGTTTVTQWDDQSGNAFIAEDVATFEPAKIDAGVNFNPTVDFSPNDRMRISGGIFGGASYTNLWTYFVINPNTAGTNTVGSEAVTGGRYITGIDGGGVSQQLGGAGTNHTFTPASLTGEFGLYTLGSSSTAGSAPSGSNQAISKNGLIINTQSATIGFTGTNDNFDLGSTNNSTDFFDGELAELIIINETPSAARQKQIESYLAIKYGITLSNNTDNDGNVDEVVSGSITEGDYILEDESTIVWNSEATYHNDVAGIGRDDAMALNQKQSKSINTDAIITIGLGTIAADNASNANTFSANKEFLVWGNNNGSVLEADVTETVLICAPEKTLARIWKIVETGNVATTKVAVDKATIDAALTTANTVKVFKVADDEAFTTNVEYLTLTDTGTEYEVDYDFNGTKYFTYTEVNGIFWTGDTNSWAGGNSSSVTNGPSTNVADVDKVMVIDAGASLTNAILTESVRVECVWVKANSKLMVSTNSFLEFDEDFILDGEIRLIGDAQLIQTHIGLSNVQGSGRIFKDQSAQVPNTFRYHYWSSPVREFGSDTFRVSSIMKDGNVPTSETSDPFDINFVGGTNYDGAPGVANVTPITISSYWIYTNLNDPGDGSAWVQQRENGVITRGQGYTMKSTGVSPQNYTFVGTPNDGSITFPIDAQRTSLLGNPYPSALDLQDFITTNIDAITGTIYFWEHTGEDSTAGTEGHNATYYQGGYSQRNISMGVAANNVESSRQYTLDWESATDSGTTVTDNETDVENNIDVDATVSFNPGSAQLVNASGLGGSSGNIVKREEGLGTYSTQIELSDIVDVQSIFVFNDVAAEDTANIIVSTPQGAANAEVAQVLTGNTGVNINLSWTDVRTIRITSSTPINIGIDNITFSEGDAITFGDGTYTPPNRYMAVGQGFFVSSTTGGTVRFENSHRNYRNNNFGEGGTFFFRDGNNTNDEDEEIDLLPVLKLGFGYFNQNDVPLHRQIGISFRAANTFGFEKGYDSDMFDVNPTDMYWNFDEAPDKNLVIAGVPAITSQLEVPITLNIDTNDPVFIMIDEQKNIDRTVYIHDKVTDVYHNLAEQLELNLPQGMYKDRFYLRFGESALSNDDVPILETTLYTFVNQDRNELVVQNRGNTHLKKVEIFNLLGQSIKSWNVNSTEPELLLNIEELKSSIYIVNILTEDGRWSKKIMVE